MKRRASNGCFRVPRALLCLALGAAAVPWAVPSRAELPVEQTGRVLTLPEANSHWAFVADLLQRRSALVDLDSGKMLGMISAGFGPVMPLVAESRGEFLLPETHYSRGSRGVRTDVLTIYDAKTLAPVDEVVLPPKRAISAMPSGHAALTDDDRFAAVFNLTPAASISIVDVAERRLAGEIATPGCSLVYPVSGHRFLMLCLDGAALVIELDERGNESRRLRTETFFDPEADPITERGVRIGDRWLFPSFNGYVYEADLSDKVPRFPEPWSLMSDAERDDDWKIGGTRHAAIHRASGRYFTLMHQGGVDSHKDSGTEIWVYDLASQERVQRIEIEAPGLTFMGVPIHAPESWVWPFRDMANGTVNTIAEGMGIDEIRVTQGEDPLLVTGSNFTGGLALFDAEDGKFLRRIYTGNMTNMGVLTPFGDSP